MGQIHHDYRAIGALNPSAGQLAHGNKHEGRPVRTGGRRSQAIDMPFKEVGFASLVDRIEPHEAR